MRNYIDDCYSIEHYRIYNPEEAVSRMELALKQLQMIYRGHDESEFGIVEVDGYECVALIVDEFTPMVIADTVAPFDMARNYPIQHIKARLCFTIL